MKWIGAGVIVVLIALVVGAGDDGRDPSEIFAPPGRSYVDIGGEYVPVPSDWLPGDPIPAGGRDPQGAGAVRGADRAA